MAPILRVVHGVGWYFPESSGGTEVYVSALAKHLGQLQVHSSVVAPAGDQAPHSYEWDGIPVQRYAVGDAGRADVVDAVPHSGFSTFQDAVRQHQPDIYHQHSWTRGCGVHHLRFAKLEGISTVLTVHVPVLVCPRGTMMFRGSDACNTPIQVPRCTVCWSEARGVPATFASWQARHPSASSAISAFLPHSPIKTMFSTPALVARHASDVAQAALYADKVVAVCRWLRESLAANGVPESKLVYSAQGIDLPDDVAPITPRVQHGPFTVGFIGRWDHNKGIHVLVEAFRRLPAEVEAELVVHGLPGDREYEHAVRNAARGLTRIRFEESVSRNRIFEVLGGFDILAVPSVWLETGPLVVLEAFAAGTPVLGSDLGGISELLTNAAGANAGLLVEAGNPGAWADAIARLASTPARQWSSTPTPRRASDIAVDMRHIYDEILAS